MNQLCRDRPQAEVLCARTCLCRCQFGPSNRTGKGENTYYGYAPGPDTFGTPTNRIETAMGNWWAFVGGPSGLFDRLTSVNA